MLSAKPGDIRKILDNPLIARIEGEELGKFFRFAIEAAKVDAFLDGNYTKRSLQKLSGYKTALALEQDASSSGAQIIALTTRNRQLAELSNVVPTNQKQRLYDVVAADTFNDPRFKKLNEKLGLNEKDLRKASKALSMVSFYGAGPRTGALNVETKLAKILGKGPGTLVVTAKERDIILNEISARAARYERFDKVTALELKALRKDVRDIFNKGIDPGADIMSQLYFLDSATKDVLEKMSRNYNKVITPEDFKQIAKLMSGHLEEQVPILKDFTRFMGRLAESYLNTAKPASAAFDWKVIAKMSLLGGPGRGYIVSKELSKYFGDRLGKGLSTSLGFKEGERISERFLKNFGFWKPNGTLKEIIYGVSDPLDRRTGAKYLKLEAFQLKTLNEIEILHANKLPKSWTNVPWVNFDGKIVEQNFTQVFEERLAYKNKFGDFSMNILQIPQKTTLTWWEDVINKSGKVNDIADTTKARTAFGVNANHSNDAVVVKKFHEWGKANNVPTSTIHDAFFANTAQMVQARKALREIYADVLDSNVIKKTLDEMLSRGLPKAVYNKYLEEAIAIGLIPVPGKSRIGGKLMLESDLLKKEDILRDLPDGFEEDYAWYGIG